RCTENRHSTQNFCTPPHGFYRFPLFWPTGIHFYCTSGRFCGHLSDDGLRDGHDADFREVFVSLRVL
ncbi:MAG: hypothetical protein K6A62_02915, partial [Bacteroidales bacterium]|nr:hypothetical protein [Bacteroidales bacterium]